MNLPEFTLFLTFIISHCRYLHLYLRTYTYYSVPLEPLGKYLSFRSHLWPWGSTQPLTEISTTMIPGGKGGRCVRLTTLPPSCAVVTKCGNRNFLEPSGSVLACNGTALHTVCTVCAIYFFIKTVSNIKMFLKGSW